MSESSVFKPGSCRCEIRVFVCPEHMRVAREELTAQLSLVILDNESSVSGLVKGKEH